MRSPENKLYVNIETGVVYHKPEKVNGLGYDPPKKLYEITEEQARRIGEGEALRAVLREGIREKVEAELDATVPVEDVPVEDVPVEDVPVEDVPVEDVPVEDVPVEEAPTAEVELLTTHKAVGLYAANRGLEIPAGCVTVQAKKDFINTALLRQD